MKQTARLTVVLGGTCLIASVVLAVGNLVTLEPRAQAETRERQRSLRLLLPAFRNDPLAEARRVPVSGDDGQPGGEVTFYPARDAETGGALVALAATATSSRGYGGQVTILAALAPDGTVQQVMVTSHAETPGLGTRVVDRRRTRSLWRLFSPTTDTGLPPSAYLDQFNGRAAADLGAPELAVIKTTGQPGPRQVAAVSGATVSSRAVADAVNQVCAAFVAHRAELVGP